MRRNIIKMGIVALVAFGVFKLASFSINELVIETKNKQKTLADLLIQKEVAKQLDIVQKQIDEEVQKENLVIEEEKIEMKPPLPEKPKKALKKEVVSETSKKEEQLKQEEKLAEEVQKEQTVAVLATIGKDDLGKQDPRIVAVRQSITEGITLTKEQIAGVTAYLIDNYFLDGYIYSEQETDALRKERKILANDMETYVIKSLDPLVNSFMNFKDFKKGAVTDSAQQMNALKVEFNEKYADVKSKGPEFEAIYNHINTYFDTANVALNKMEEIVAPMDASNPSYNPVLALPVFIQQMTKEVLPAVKDVINQGIDLKEKTNVIFLEGVEGRRLLSREEVVELIMSTGMNVEGDIGFSLSSGVNK
ncbi:hypothetical protein CS063_08525 [Sporanaerobium hydrogeniformans]|uniref:Uncharacterized protein n=1 Tax=Sporanaerobium hydrogeniformans TaxID=3072179 RepID=A0AC61DCQ4_9FIRM|nr:hypothetical protein [Sporanaerobium hydrogeniformans]PHV70803.1 hypothetical protein CS063_08525 [Sporanaerobium hydrogeniformans]